MALAHLLAEDKRPPETLWSKTLVSSRLLEYELWTRINAKGLRETHGDLIRALLGRVSLLELAPVVLARALEPFPVALRTLDALHVASIEFLRGLRQEVELASYDDRMLKVARRLGIPVLDLGG
ncbi:MAG: PIN domain-containing protein [Planctomycetes bacterium]|nr:PIN domain-containing protein [Planctomycetota bacterium]